MRKVSILLVVALIATSCAVGTYHPYARNNFGAQSTVVLDKANFRVVRDVEAIVDVNNTNLSRADVASSAYGELLRKAQLTGSQVLINVVIEEVRRESTNIFRLLFGFPKRVQHVAARATIIEFLDEHGNPTVSESYRPTNTHTTTVTQKCEQAHKQIVKLSQHYTGGRVFNKYNNIYKSLPETQENILNLQKIQYVVISHLNSQGTAFPQIEKELKNASSMEAEIAVFLSYYKE